MVEVICFELILKLVAADCGGAVAARSGEAAVAGLVVAARGEVGTARGGAEGLFVAELGLLAAELLWLEAGLRLWLWRD